MAKRAIGIDISNERLRIVQIAKDKDGFHLEKTISVSLRRSSDDPVEFFKTLHKEHGLNRKTPVALALPAASLCFRHTDQDKTEQRAQETGADWLDEFPFSAETIVTDGCAYNHLPEQRQTYLMAATDQETITRQCEPLRQTGWNIQHIDVPILALHTLALHNHPDQTGKPALLIFEHDSHMDLLVFHAGEIIAIRSLPLPANTIEDPVEKHANWLMCEMEMTWRMAFNEMIPPATPFITAGPIADDTLLLKTLGDSLLLEVVCLNPKDGITIPEDSPITDDDLLAQALALRCLLEQSGSTLNFQNVLTNNEKQRPQKLRQPALVSLFLIAAIGLTIFATFYAKRLVLENHHKQLKTQIRTHFLNVKPNETNIVNEKAQLQTYLTSLQKQHQQLAASSKTGSTPLDILTQINRQSTGIAGLTMNRIQINPENILIDARCKNTEQLNTWQKKLDNIESFASIERQSITPDKATDTVSFILQITLAQEQL